MADSHARVSYYLPPRDELGFGPLITPRGQPGGNDGAVIGSLLRAAEPGHEQVSGREELRERGMVGLVRWDHVGYVAPVANRSHLACRQEGVP